MKTYIITDKKSGEIIDILGIENPEKYLKENPNHHLEIASEETSFLEDEW
ncbi:MAG: hypothetical protein PF569_01735 [Candidatus Woesearchaeota archaeon]|jgi:hypothetical protein|nr:hypothetical protein [Candidatus Woesearchaeota archaeon]